VKDCLMRWLAWKLPRTLVYWCSIRLVSHATTGPWSNEEAPRLLAMDAVNRWHYPQARLTGPEPPKEDG